MAKLPQGDRFTTIEGRASYAHVFRPRKNDRDEDKYELTLLFPKDAPGLKEMKKAAQQLGEQHFGSGFADMVRAGRVKFPFRDGDTQSNDPNYKGMTFMAARNDRKPQVVDRNLNELTTPEDFGSGDYCRVTCRFFVFESKGNKGVSCSLGNIQRTRRGERLDNAVDARKEFDALPDDGSGGDDFSDGKGAGFDADL